MNTEEVKEQKKTVKITDVVSITLRHWPWIVVSVMVCVTLAALYALHKQPTYVRNAAIVLKDDNQGGSSIGSQFSMFASMGMMGGGMNLRDEVNKLQSPDLMAEVVRRLDLNTSYMLPGRFRKKVAYGDSLPVKVLLPDMAENEDASFELQVAPNGDMTVKDFSGKGNALPFTQKAPFTFDHPVQTPVGKLIVTKGPNYIPGEPYTVYISRIPVFKAASNYNAALDISLQDIYANTIEMTISDTSIQRAEDVINTVINVYNENWILNKNEVSLATTKFINDRLVSLERELGGVDKDIADYQSANLMPDVSQATLGYVKDNQKADDQILETNNRLQVARYMRQHLADVANKDQVLPANSGIDNLAIESQISEYNKKLLGRNRLAVNSSENHPVITNLDNELVGMRAAILSSIDNEISALQTRLNNAQGLKNRAETSIANAPGQASHLLGIGRQQKVKESLYLFLLQKREENELSRAFTAYNTEVIAKPYGENAPSSPRKVLICAFAFMFGLFLPFGVTFVKQLINTKVRERKDLHNLTIPVVGEIPAWKPTRKQRAEMKESGKNPEIVVESGNRNVINDAFRVMRANLRFLHNSNRADANHGAVMMVTSMHAGSGKSFVTGNLAVSLALRDRKVIIVDGDLRHGSASELVGSPSKGITNYLNGATDDLDSLIVHDRLHKNADVLPVGQFPPNPTELLEGPLFKEAIEQLRNQYDYVLIDCPPVNAMADAKIIDKLSDRCLFVIRVGLFNLEDLPLLERMYQDKAYNNMSLILNGTTDANSSKFGYADNYHTN